jgi:nitrogen fixation protein NifB
MLLDLTLHPCFNAETRQRTGRVHLAVAPKCNIQCHYCNRAFDCVNESRPGVASAVLTPRQALTYLKRALQRMPALKVVGIAGPGDPFATPRETLETLRLVRENYPDMLLCVASNGLNIHPYVAELARLQVSHVTLTVNAVSTAVGSNIYAWVRDGRTIYRGEAAAGVLLQRQRRALKELKGHGITVKINTIVVPGVNEGHVEEVAKEMAERRADIMNCIPLYPVKGTPFARTPELSHKRVLEIRETVAGYLPQMNHCTRCRADAAGLLGAPQSVELTHIMQACASGALEAEAGRAYVAVATMEGILVNQHLGEADELWVYAPGPGGPRLVETRPTPEAGGGNLRWLEMAESLKDCHAVIVNGVGANPRRILEREGLHIIEMSGLISEGLNSLFRTGSVPPTMRKQFQSCGLECQGSGTGCG